MTNFSVTNLKEKNVINGTQHSLCCTLIKNMQTDVCLLQREITKLTPLEEQYREYLKEFLQLTQLVDSKLHALWATATLFESEKILKTREFVRTITTTWKVGDEEIRKKIRNTQLVSQDHPDIPLEQFIQAIRAHFIDLRKNIDAIPRHTNCCHVAHSKNNEINQLFNHLSHLDNILQHYISLGRANPFLQNLNNVIDQFIIHEGFLGAIYGVSVADKIWVGGQHQSKSHLPGIDITAKQTFELSAFNSMVKLLTGELLGHEPLDPLSGLEPLVKDSKLEIYLVPSTSVKNTSKSFIWKSLSDVDQSGIAKDLSLVKMSSVADNSIVLNISKDSSSDSKNADSIKERLSDTVKQPYKESTPPWKHRKHKLRDYIGASVDADLQPIKIPRIEGALLPPLS